LKEAHATLSRSEWLQQKVDASSAGLADSSGKVIVEDDWDRVRAEKKAKRDTFNKAGNTYPKISLDDFEAYITLDEVHARKNYP